MNDELKQKLLSKRDALYDRLDAIKQDYSRGLDQNLSEQAVQLENAEVLNGISKAAIEELEQIEQQLAKLETAFMP